MEFKPENRYTSLRINKGYEATFIKFKQLAKEKKVSVNKLLNEAIKEFAGRRN